MNQQTDSPITRPRGVDRLVTGRATSDGAGVKLTRVRHPGPATAARPFPDAGRISQRQIRMTTSAASPTIRIAAST